jgi:lactoylglutathione lyase
MPDDAKSPANRDAADARPHRQIPGITGLAHVALRVKEFDRALDFYVSKLGLAEMMRMSHADGSPWIIYLRISDTQFIELFDKGEGERAPERERLGLNHFCLEVDDLENVVAELAERGVALTRPMKVGADHNKQAWIEDPDGHRIELMEMAPHSLQAAAIARLWLVGKAGR